MKALHVPLLLLLLWAGLSAIAGEEARAPALRASGARTSLGLEAARTMSAITGVAISPLLGLGALGAWDYLSTPPAERPRLHWYARPWFWVTALALVGLSLLKDLSGLAVPGVVKKPFDIAEALENKISALIAAGAFVPLMASLFARQADSVPSAWFSAPPDGAMFAAIGGGAWGDWVAIPAALVVFALVWVVSHSVQVLILMSPFGVIDAALKGLRLAALGLLAWASQVHPYLGAAVALLFIVLAYFLAGWAVRLLIFGQVMIWDLLTMGQRRCTPGKKDCRVFAARRFGRVRVRTYGRLRRQASGQLVFEYRPGFVLRARSVPVPQGQYAIGRGLLYPALLALNGPLQTATFTLPPRYRSHEATLAARYGLGEVRDVGLRRGLKAAWSWVKSLVSPAAGASEVA